MVSVNMLIPEKRGLCYESPTHAHWTQSRSDCMREISMTFHQNPLKEEAGTAHLRGYWNEGRGSDQQEANYDEQASSRCGHFGH